MMYATSLIKSLRGQSNILLLTNLKILYCSTRINSILSRMESPKSQLHSKLYSKMQQLVETHLCRSEMNQVSVSLVTRPRIGPNFYRIRVQAKSRNCLSIRLMDKTLRCNSSLKSLSRLTTN